MIFSGPKYLYFYVQGPYLFDFGLKEVIAKMPLDYLRKIMHILENYCFLGRGGLWCMESIPHWTILKLLLPSKLKKK